MSTSTRNPFVRCFAIIALSGALAPRLPAAPSWTVYETARDNGHTLTEVAGTGAPPGPAGEVIVVNRSENSKR